MLRKEHPLIASDQKRASVVTVTRRNTKLQPRIVGPLTAGFLLCVWFESWAMEISGRKSVNAAPFKSSFPSLVSSSRTVDKTLPVV